MAAGSPAPIRPWACALANHAPRAAWLASRPLLSRVRAIAGAVRLGDCEPVDRQHVWVGRNAQDRRAQFDERGRHGFSAAWDRRCQLQGLAHPTRPLPDALRQHGMFVAEQRIEVALRHLCAGCDLERAGAGEAALRRCADFCRRCGAPASAPVSWINIGFSDTSICYCCTWSAAGRNASERRASLT
jgi:hypothetical protein